MFMRLSNEILWSRYILKSLSQNIHHFNEFSMDFINIVHEVHFLPPMTYTNNYEKFLINSQSSL